MRVWRVFESFIEQGKVKELGISNTYNLNMLQRIYEAATVKPSYLQNRFYAQTHYDREIHDFCRAHGIRFQTFWTLTANPNIIHRSALALFTIFKIIHRIDSVLRSVHFPLNTARRGNRYSIDMFR